MTGFQDSVLGEWDFTYDWLNRLTTATGVSGSFNGITVATASQGWTYDSFGNRVGQTQGSLQTPTHWAGYDPSTNQTLTSDLAPGGVGGGVSTDADGRILNDGSKSYIWEAQGWLCGVTAATGSHYQYIYDAEGNLVTTASRANAGCDLSVTTLSDFVIGQSGEKVSEVTAAHAWKDTNIYAYGQLLATYTGSGLHFALSDWLGTKRIQTSPTGAVELTCWNLPFNDGYGCSGTGPDATDLHYTGKEHDPYTALDLFGARDYTNYSGRFLSPDPKMPSMKFLTNPQKWNKYAYVLNNPLSLFDPDGQEEKTIVYRTFIAPAAVVFPSIVGGISIFAGDGRGFSTAPNASSRTTITVKIETDPSIRPGDPIINQSSSAGPSLRIDPLTGTSAAGTATQGLPVAIGARDANGNAMVNISQDTSNPVSGDPQFLTPGISANINMTFSPDGSLGSTSGQASNFPWGELNVTGANGSTNSIYQYAPGASSSPFSLFGSHDVTPKPPACQSGTPGCTQ